MVVNMSKGNEAFGNEVKRVMAATGLSLRAVEYKTGIDHTTVLGMVNGRVPKKGTIIDFAQGLGENINTWLSLAGYDIIPEHLIREYPANATEIPKPVRLCIEQAVTRAEKVQCMFAYVQSDKSVKFGAAVFSKLPADAKLSIIRMYEDLKHVKLVPEDFV